MYSYTMVSHSIESCSIKISKIPHAVNFLLGVFWFVRIYMLISSSIADLEFFGPKLLKTIQINLNTTSNR